MTGNSRAIAVAGAHRTIRVLADGEGPFPGELVSRDAGVAVQTPVTRLRDWPGWAHAGDEHIAAPLDIVLRAEGLDVLLPWCVRTVEAHLIRCGEGGAVPRGEAVTLAVSMLRGVVELAPGRGGGVTETAENPHGQWWLTDEGRPVFVLGRAGTADDEGVCAAAQRHLRDLEGRVEDRALRRLLLRLADALHESRRLRAEAARWEQELLDIAAPRPLRVAEEPRPDHGRDTVGSAPLRRAPSPRRRDLRASEGMHARRSDTRAGGVLRGAVRGRALRLATRLAHGLARRRAPGDPPGAGAPRRRWVGPAVVAATAAAVIMVGGALWPDDRDGAGAADHVPKPSPSDRAGSMSATAPPEDSAEFRPVPAASDAPRPPRPSAQHEAGDAGQELLSAARRCRAQPAPDATRSGTRMRRLPRR